MLAPSSHAATCFVLHLQPPGNTRHPKPALTAGPGQDLRVWYGGAWRQHRFTQSLLLESGNRYVKREQHVDELLDRMLRVFRIGDEGAVPARALNLLHLPVNACSDV